MADSKISALTAASTLTGTETLAGVQSAANVKITANQLKTWALTSPAFTGTASFAGAVAFNDLLECNAAAQFDSAATFNSTATFNGLISLVNGQIAFPATQNPSAGANTLDDYEEGTHTPVLLFGGAAVGMTYGSQSGLYTKIGRHVVGQSNFALTAKGSSTGAATAGGLPFTCNNVTTTQHLTNSALVDLNVGGGFYSAAGFSFNSTSVSLVELGDNVASANLTEADFANTSSVNLNHSYAT